MSDSDVFLLNIRVYTFISYVVVNKANDSCKCVGIFSANEVTSLVNGPLLESSLLN